MADKHQLMARMNASRGKAKKIMDKEMAKTYPSQAKQDEREEEQTAEEATAPEATPANEPVQASNTSAQYAEPVIDKQQKESSPTEPVISPSEAKTVREEGIGVQKATKRGRKPKNEQEGKKEQGYKNLAVPPSYHHKVSVFSKLARSNSLAFVCQAIDEFVDREQKAGRLPKMDI